MPKICEQQCTVPGCNKPGRVNMKHMGVLCPAHENRYRKFNDTISEVPIGRLYNGKYVGTPQRFSPTMTLSRRVALAIKDYYRTLNEIVSEIYNRLPSTKSNIQKQRLVSSALSQLKRKRLIHVIGEKGNRAYKLNTLGKSLL